MKKLLFVAITILLVVACKQNTPDTTAQISKDTQTDFTSFGDVITSDNVLSGIKPMMSPIVKVFVSRLDATVPIT